MKLVPAVFYLRHKIKYHDMKYTNIVKYLFILGFVFLAGNALAQTTPGSCTLIPSSKTCIDAIPCKIDSSGNHVCLSGVTLQAGWATVNQTCWQYSYQYACSSPGINTCGSYQANPACYSVSSLCQNTVPATGLCDSWQMTYQCTTQPAQTTTVMSCGDPMLNPNAIPPQSNPNQNFYKGVVAQEILNEGTAYSDKGILFGGVHESCTKGDFGIHECCGSHPGAASNSMIMSANFSAGASVLKFAGSAAIDWATPYVFDAMFSNGIWVDAMAANVDANAGEFAANYSGTSVSAYGFTYASTAPAAGSGLFGGNTVLVTNSDGSVIYYNPYVLGAMIAIMVYQDLASCTAEEQLLALHKGASLSEFIVDNCTNNTLLGCAMYQDDYCSFNSVLARIINVQGKRQLGLNVADCSGIPIDKLALIDFSVIDFSAFTGSMVSNQYNPQVMPTADASGTLSCPTGYATPIYATTPCVPTNISIGQNAQNNAPTQTTFQNGYTPILNNVTQGSAQNKNSAVVPAY
jgi:conjugal transfer mating pair stabilization protein TraN